MLFALDHIPLHAVGVGSLEKPLPIDAGNGAAVLEPAGLPENGVEPVRPRALMISRIHASVLFGVESGAAVRILHILLARIVAGGGRPADILLVNN